MWALVNSYDFLAFQNEFGKGQTHVRIGRNG